MEFVQVCFCLLQVVTCRRFLFMCNTVSIVQPTLSSSVVQRALSTYQGVVTKYQCLYPFATGIKMTQILDDQVFDSGRKRVHMLILGDPLG